jgi:hypothetical protein
MNLSERKYSGNCYTKQHIDLSGELDLEGCVAQPVVIQTSGIIYLILYVYIVVTVALPRIEFHKLRFNFTLILSGFYNDRGGKTEGYSYQVHTGCILLTVRTAQRTTYLLL